MKRKPNAEAVDSRAVLDRYGDAQRKLLYKRIAAGAPFALFVIDGRLSTVLYPSPRFQWLHLDCPAELVGIYIEMPSWERVNADLLETEAALASRKRADMPLIAFA